MTPTEAASLTALEQKARAAKALQGVRRWPISNSAWMTARLEFEHIEACSPDVVLHLIQRVREGETLLTRAIAAIEDLQVNYIGILAFVHRGDAIAAIKAIRSDGEPSGT